MDIAGHTEDPISAVTTASANGERRRATAARLGLTASERVLLLRVADLLMLNLALLGALALRYEYPFSWSVLWQAPWYFVILSFLWLLWASFFNCYELPLSADASRSAWASSRAAFAAALTYLAIPVYTPHFPASRLSALIFLLLAVASVAGWRGLYAMLFVQPTFQQRVLIVGAGLSGSELARELAGKPRQGNPFAGSGLDLVGFVDDNPAKKDTIVEGVPVLGDRHDLCQLVQEHQVDILVLAITHTREIHPTLFRSLVDCREWGVQIEPMTSLFERMTGKVPVEHAARNLHVILPFNDSPMRRALAWAKRLFDIGVGVVGLTAMVVVSPLVALLNMVWSPGPLLYRQLRVGKGGGTFELVKFRSMVPGAEEESGPVWARVDDPRITTVGRLLRRTRLDELPQFWNVFKGEMSLVGPRPERPEFVADLLQQVPFYQARHAVRPGITGWAQVRYRYGSSVMDTMIKLQYDLYYIKHQSFYLEISIMVKTAAVILGLRGR